MRVVQRTDDQDGFRVLGTCADADTVPEGGGILEALVPAAEFPEDPLWGPVVFRTMRWPVATVMPEGEAVVVVTPRSPDPAHLPGWAPAAA